MRAPTRSNHTRASRRAALAFSAGLIAAAPLVLASAASASPSAQAPKCKNASHLRVHSSNPGASLLQPADVEVVAESANCRNDVSYHGSMYVIVVHGKDGLHLLPDGATYVRQQFSALAGHRVELDHPINQVFTDWHDFSDAARAKVARQLVAFGM
jgi:proline racemase